MKAVPLLRRNFVTSCAEAEEEEALLEETPSLVEEADALLDIQKSTMKTPPHFDNLKALVRQGEAGTYDGFRLIVQKQVNLNTVVTHFFWLGSQATGQPIYQYRIILPFDESTVLNCATDADFNIEGDYKMSLSKNITWKVAFANGDNKQSLTTELEHTDSNSATSFQYAKDEEDVVTFGRMQAITPQLCLGAMGSMPTNRSMELSTTYGGMYDDSKNVVVVNWDSSLRLLYMRRVNPNRVHLTSDLAVSPDGNSHMTLGAEYQLKQSKINMSVDSNLEVKSMMETTIVPGVQLQFSAEMAHLQKSYKFGYGIVMG